MAFRIWIVVILSYLFVYTEGHAQQFDGRIEALKNRLEVLSEDLPQLNKKISSSVSDISLYEFLRALGISNKLNFDVSTKLDSSIAVNFSNVEISALLVYLAERYDLDITVTGSIITITKYQSPPVVAIPPEPKKIEIEYDSVSGRVSFSLQRDTLEGFVRKVTELTPVNLFAQQKLQTMLISGYVRDMPLQKALKEIAQMNNLHFTTRDSTTFYLEEVAGVVKTPTENAAVPFPAGLKLVTNKKDSILSISASAIPIKEVLAGVASQLNLNYFLFSDLKGSSDLKTTNIDFNTFLDYLFNGTEYTYRFNNGVYLIGERRLEEIRTAEVYPMQYRTVTKLTEQIPAELKKGLEIIPLPEMNSLVIAGSNPAIKELKDFLRQIDKIVPVVNIELIILDVRKSSAVSTGLMAGVDNSKSTSFSSLFPSVDVTLSANSINNVLDGINGTGLVNLGNVSPGFYVSLKASEDNGFLRIRSTPRLATLNGNEAQMSIGETRYYAEQTTNVITTQSTTTVTGVVFKELQANFGITIKPIVSGDEQITLDISVEQSTFTEQFTKNGPYGRLTRSFKSSLRVRNDDMILLGGLDEKNTSDAGQGLPLLSRVPVLKWLFSSRSSSSKKNKLAILIHPTVFY